MLSAGVGYFNSINCVISLWELLTTNRLIPCRTFHSFSLNGTKLSPNRSNIAQSFSTGIYHP